MELEEHEVVAGRLVVVLVRIETPDCVFPVEHEAFRGGELQVSLQTQLVKLEQRLRVVVDLAVAHDDAFVVAYGLAEFEPLVLPYGVNARSLFWILSQYHFNEIDDVLADEARHQISAFKYFLVKLRRIRVLEGQKAADESVQDDSAAPQVNFIASVLQARNHLWGRVARTAARGLKQLVLREGVGEPEVYNLDVVLMVEQQVFGLQISVHDVQ